MENNDDIQEPQVTQPTEDPIKELLQKQEEKIGRLEKALSDNNLILKDLLKRQVQYYKILFYQPLVAVHHQKVFASYRGIHKNQEVVLLASGPTLNHFSPDMIPNAVFVGVNKVIMSERLRDFLNYWFVTDYVGLKGVEKEISKIYLPRCKRFFGIMKVGHESEKTQEVWQFPISYIEENNGQYFYITDSALFPYDISLLPFTSCGSVIFPCLQFTVYTHPKRIYLIGCDCRGAHFNDAGEKVDPTFTKRVLKWWTWSHDFLETYYPDIEVISVNPVGLKGMFRDVYTKSYLAEHPEIDPSTVEIIDK